MRRELSCLRALGAVLGASLLTILNTLGVQRTADDVVTHTRQVLNTTAADQHDAVFLQVVAFTTDVRNDLKAVGLTHLGNLTQSGVRLLRGCGVHARANATLLRAVLERGALAFIMREHTGLTH